MNHGLDDLQAKEDKTLEEGMLLHAIAVLSGHFRFVQQSPWEIYDILKEDVEREG